MDKNYVILAPHADDEIIGCFDVLSAPNHRVSHVVYPNYAALQEAREMAEMFGVELALTGDLIDVLKAGGTLFAPDPNYDYHPEHRRWGHTAERTARENNDINVVWYNTNMNAPYIREVRRWKRKRDLLNKFYPAKSSLWEYDHRYYLFEGQCTWIMKWGD